MDRWQPPQSGLGQPDVDPADRLTAALGEIARAISLPLPTHFAGRRIVMRVPYAMPGEQIVAPATSADLPANAFLNNVDKPMEVHDVIMSAVSVSAADVPIVSTFAGAIGQRMRITIVDFTKNQQVTKLGTLADSLFDTNTLVWTWDQPYVLLNSEGFTVNFTNLVPAGGDRIRLAITFRGFLLALG